MRLRLAAFVAATIGMSSRMASGQATPVLICGAHESEIKVDSLTDSVRTCMRHFEAEVMRAQFEHSYITSTSLGGNQPHLVFEGNIAPAFSLVTPGKNLALVMTPKVVMRMFAENSVPVKTPSYMPRVTAYLFAEPTVKNVRDSTASFMFLTLSHHSNGQSGPFLNPDGSVNHETGNFSTNFLEYGAVTGGALGANATLTVRSSVEWHPKAWYDDSSNVHYSHLRPHVGFNFSHRGAHNGNAEWNAVSLDVAITYLAGDVAVPFHGRGRFPLMTNVIYRPSWAREIAWLLSGYWGQDYYNTYFDQSRSMVRIGVSAGSINGSFGR